MAVHLVVGAGYIGEALARALVARGDTVLVATRSGTTVLGTTSITVDASDPDALAAAAAGAATIFLATGPRQYHRWPELWPPMHRAAIEAAHLSAARLVLMGNLYGYGKDSAMPMSETTPLHPTEPKGQVRADGWELALAAQARGEIDVVEVRASDYFGPGAGRNSQLGSAFFGPVLAGRSARIFGSATEPHSWCYLADIVATLIAAADHRGPWGRVWHVPAAEPLSRAEIAEQVNRLTGEEGSVKALSPAFLRLLGVLVPFIRAANDSSYQFNRPFLVDSIETERLLGVHATPWAESLAFVIESYRAPAERADA
ncbi:MULTISPECIES: NAD-dependent epimerase/dehydratase family protein [Cryobacterium]|uniref:NAD-dependent epimerase/dehydratase family protein n=1 Tax=Cryobacterium breve TaxID=1259258 RepID=A0ABY2IUW5_9MICO|nr:MULTISPECIES: NAD-dependent epimerase/dehydratase family protein [Cryobacterium]TFC94653.1 NAD-dependent epimerase/dehydratase family protein [Cryobacterium sp. TmT3-12]TFC95397.1 NAD-dependent epimerase/dehydratase family protein [Cryobacterium breve]